MVNLNSAYPMYILVYTSITDSENSIAQSWYILSFYCVFHFIPYNMSCTALDMYHMILKHHETMPLSGKSFDVR